MWVFLIASSFFSCWILLDVAVLAKPCTVDAMSIVLQLWAESTVGAINCPSCPLCQRVSTLAVFLCKLKQHQRWQRKDGFFWVAASEQGKACSYFVCLCSHNRQWVWSLTFSLTDPNFWLLYGHQQIPWPCSKQELMEDEVVEGAGKQINFTRCHAHAHQQQLLHGLAWNCSSC